VNLPDVNHDDLTMNLEYAKVKHEATVAVRQAFDQHTRADQQILEVCFGLISTATVVGNLDKARMHLKILARLTSTD
jgi:hypothetical protein